ncbi:TetR/AcrR family transcriptional regulator [Parahaliea sp. F7430]|uniref:TetR/AcrR family transcriptional regulator n=1 Tax=Sediminihaliea albiluteola TaxID=2758564 RepID=A0A7W2TTT4_9GAMM|nr:TetR/AcrR family transcriptional regulator [Sediminihaliea albiluteola]MBA6411733.1 TetR/AcrR family transcriptional regulator [Sediminihaliea albiluteola]
MKRPTGSENVGRAATTAERILNVAAEHFGELGYQAATMTRIAANAGLSRAALYKHYPNKESLLLALHERLVTESVKRSRELLAADEPAPDVIRHWLENYLVSEGMRREIHVATLPDTQLPLLIEKEATEKALKKVRNALVAVIKRGIREGYFDSSVNPGQTAHILQALTFSLLRNNMSPRPVLTLSDAAQIRALSSTIIKGMMAHN